MDRRFLLLVLAAPMAVACSAVDPYAGCPGHETALVSLVPDGGVAETGGDAGADAAPADAGSDCTAVCKAQPYGDELESCRFVTGTDGTPKAECHWLVYCE